MRQDRIASRDGKFYVTPFPSLERSDVPIEIKLGRSISALMACPYLEAMRYERPNIPSPQETLEALQRAGRGRVRSTELIETHFAWVFLVDSLAYKLKKPLRRGSMDYRSIARRKRGCRSELRLNRRLARSAYLAVVPLVRKRDGGLRLGPGRPIVDWIVEMRRLPAARMLDRVISGDGVTRRDVRVVTALLSHFFKHARHEPMSARAYVARLRLRVREARRELRARDLGLNQRRVEEVVRAQREFMAQGDTLLGSRGSHLIDGHGDLRPEHVFLGSRSDRPCVIDCLEFDSDLRRLDPAEEMAFLGIECIQLGASGFANDLLRSVRVATGDPVSDVLMHFYMSQRATNRAMIAAWHLRAARFAQQPRRWKALASAYLDDALYYARLALRELESQRGLALECYRPMGQERRHRLAREHSPHSLSEQWRDR